MKSLSSFKLGIHMMPTVAAGTFSLNCAYFGIPAIGNIKVDTQRICHPDLSVDVEDMESALKIAAEIIANLPQDTCSPESTEEKQGFIHPTDISGHVEEAQIDFILRDFDTQKLKEYAEMLKQIAHSVLLKYPKSTIRFEQKEQYRNMYEVLKHYPQCMDLAMEAMQLAGLNPETRSIRGGTDGSRLTFMGLPCPNIFAGEHAFHSKQEWVSVQDMHKATETVVYLASLITK
jgi:tripeptide aminopeptidase